MYRVYDNGSYRDMTLEEVDEFNRLQQKKPPDQPPTIDQRVENLEGDTAELKEALNMILTGVTE